MSYLHERESQLGRRRISKTLYLLAILGGFGIVEVAAFLLVGPSTSSQVGPLVALVFAGVILFLSGLVRFWYRAWFAIQDSETSPSPLVAIGLMFAPGGGGVWMLFMPWRYADQFNDYVARNGLSVPELSEDLFVALPLTLLVTSAALVVPYAGYVLVWAFPIAHAVVIDRVCGRLNAIEDIYAGRLASN